MGETDSTISLMWNKATHSSGIKEYLVYRDNTLIATTSNTHYKDKNLDASTKYKYTVKAVSVDGVYSEESNELTVSTKVPVIPNPGAEREFKLGSIPNPELYEKGEIVSYEGTNYISLVTHYNYGDASWSPKEAHSLFKAC